jgi:hypothetical protein
MRGTGRIFDAYGDGALQDDDEVAVLHGPEKTGYVPLTEAMVNIRCDGRAGGARRRAASRRFAERLPAGRPDQKRMDALARRRAACRPRPDGPARPL